MPNTFIVWNCCSYSTEDTLDDALGMAYAIDWGNSGHNFDRIETPDGRIITDDDPEYKTYERKQRAKEKERRAQQLKPIATVRISRPDDEPYREACYNQTQIDEIVETFGAERVTIERRDHA